MQGGKNLSRKEKRRLREIIRFRRKIKEKKREEKA